MTVPGNSAIPQESAGSWCDATWLASERRRTIDTTDQQSKVGLTMAFTEWTMQGVEFINCNCAWGCPCQFNDLPTHGNCEAFVGWEIRDGYYGDTRLDGRLVLLTIRHPVTVSGAPEWEM